jgi:hypothetical protein
MVATAVVVTAMAVSVATEAQRLGAGGGLSGVRTLTAR